MGQSDKDIHALGPDSFRRMLETASKMKTMDGQSPRWNLDQVSEALARKQKALSDKINQTIKDLEDQQREAEANKSKIKTQSTVLPSHTKQRATNVGGPVTKAKPSLPLSEKI